MLQSVGQKESDMTGRLNNTARQRRGGIWNNRKSPLCPVCHQSGL